MFCCMQISSYQFCQHFFSASKGTAVSSVIKNLTIKITDQIQRAKILPLLSDVLFLAHSGSLSLDSVGDQHFC